MVIVAFKPGEKEISKYEELDQHDYGQILRIQGLNLPPAVEIHFALQKTGGTSKTRIGITKDGVTDVLIPDSMLENGDIKDDYSIYAFVYLTDKISGQTEYRITLRVKARPKPEVPGGGDNPDIFHEAVEAVRKAMEAAAESERLGEKGEKGEPGADGTAVVTEITPGMFAMSISAEGHLIVTHHASEAPPPLKIVDGHLKYIIGEA